MENKGNINGKADVSLVVSCISVLAGCCIWYLAILCRVVSIVFGILALRGENKNQQDMAIAGIVVGGTGMAIGIVAAVLYIMLYSAAGGGTTNIQNGTGTVMMALRGVYSLFW